MDLATAWPGVASAWPRLSSTGRGASYAKATEGRPFEGVVGRGPKWQGKRGGPYPVREGRGEDQPQSR